MEQESKKNCGSTAQHSHNTNKLHKKVSFDAKPRRIQFAKKSTSRIRIRTGTRKYMRLELTKADISGYKLPRNILDSNDLFGCARLLPVEEVLPRARSRSHPIHLAHERSSLDSPSTSSPQNSHNSKRKDSQTGDKKLKKVTEVLHHQKKPSQGGKKQSALKQKQGESSSEKDKKIKSLPHKSVSNKSGEVTFAPTLDEVWNADMKIEDHASYSGKNNLQSAIAMLSNKINPEENEYALRLQKTIAKMKGKSTKKMK